jgi:hypothetical protein
MGNTAERLDASTLLKTRIEPDQNAAIDQNQADFDLLMTQEQIDAILPKKQ